MPRLFAVAAVLLALAAPRVAGAKGVRVRVRLAAARGTKSAKATRGRLERVVRSAQPRLEGCARRLRRRNALRGHAHVLIALRASAPGQVPRLRLVAVRGAPRSLGKCLLGALLWLAPRLRGPRSAAIVLTVLRRPVFDAVRADRRARVYHYKGCRRNRCRRCKRFSSALSAVRAGYRPHAACAPPDDEVPPLPRSKGPRECRRNRDCALVPNGPCWCRPCRYQWRGAATAHHVRRLRGTYARMGACSRRCAPCKTPGGLLGSRAVCHRGRCEVRP